MKKLLPLLICVSCYGQNTITYTAIRKADAAQASANAANVQAGAAMTLATANATTLTGNLSDISDISGMSAGDVVIYDGANLVAEPLTSLTSVTAYDDLRLSGLSLRVSSSPPGLAGVLGSGNLQAYHFDDTSDEQMFFALQFPHSWKQGTVIYPHVHWMPESATAGSNITWGLEYSWQNVDGEFSAPTTIVGNDLTEGTAWQHLICPLTSITNETATISSVLIGRLFRDANASETGALDDLDEDITLLSFDIHIEVDGFGSSSEYTK